ncbi:transmembrane protease serine 11G [Monomorium pharaonis]|uniref:transmembrane protease serine 11G n=1 Tax=Monomorium pharaonis TaxID=307658 RepID=UPI00174690C0|nr:transmembrane protease serine 11G [Monomorium pharaonis]
MCASCERLMEDVQLEGAFAWFRIVQACVYISDGFPYFEVIVRSLAVEVVFTKKPQLRVVVTCRITRTGALTPISMTHINIHQFVLFLLLCILQYCRCLPAGSQNIADPVVVENQEWRTYPRHTELLRFSGNISHPYLRDKRDLKKTYQACIAPGNRDGHCKHFQAGCMALTASRSLKDFGLNLVDYMCIIEETYIGLCCPDSQESIVNENTIRSKKSFYDNLASKLPTIANLDDNEEEWDETYRNEDENRLSVNKTGNANLRKDLMPAKQETRKPRKPRGCGTTARTKTKIAGGHPANPKEWPWMAALLRQGAIQYCGGVLITDRHVLTAAHCVYRFKLRDITVRLGEYDFTTSEETRALDFTVSEIRIHRDFKLNTYEHDIAIIKIHRPTVFNSYIWPICLPPIQQSFESKNAIVTGWGTQYYGGPASSVLLEAEIPVWPQERCVRSFTQLIPNTTLCAGAYEGGRDSCQGDSGGPLLHQLANGRWVNIGIVSWGIRCGEPGYPGIYTRVSSYLDWIFANAVF